MFKAANVMSSSTYIDHAGNECDARTGLPIGSRHLAPEVESQRHSAGTSGYSFYGDGDHPAGHYAALPYSNIGKVLFVNEYD